MKINIDPAKKITLYNPEFDEMRHTLDTTLQNTFKAMIKKNMSAASIGLKIDIDLIKQTINDNNAPTGVREAVKPEISARVVATMQQRTDKKCNVLGKLSHKELLVDDAGDFFLVSSDEASGQLSMFNNWEEYAEAAEAQRAKEAAAAEDADAADAEDTEQEDEE